MSDNCSSGSGAYQIDEKRKAVNCPDGRVVRISPKQYLLFRFLHMNKGHAFKSEDLLLWAWGHKPYDEYYPENIRMAVMDIRRKCGRDAIDTRPWYGYGVGLEI